MRTEHCNCMLLLDPLLVYAPFALLCAFSLVHQAASVDVGVEDGGGPALVVVAGMKVKREIKAPSSRCSRLGRRGACVCLRVVSLQLCGGRHQDLPCSLFVGFDGVVVEIKGSQQKHGHENGGCRTLWCRYILHSELYAAPPRSHLCPTSIAVAPASIWARFG